MMRPRIREQAFEVPFALLQVCAHHPPPPVARVGCV